MAEFRYEKKNIQFVPLTKRWAAEFFTVNDGKAEHILFIDRKYAKHDGGDWDKGQPTYSYYIEDIANHKKGAPLCLDCGADWWVDASTMYIATSLCEARLAA